MKMDRALLDISPDDAVDLNNKKRILRWDAKKRKFVKVCRSSYTTLSPRIALIYYMCRSAFFVDL